MICFISIIGLERVNLDAGSCDAQTMSFSEILKSRQETNGYFFQFNFLITII